MTDAAAASIANPPFPSSMERGNVVHDMRVQRSVGVVRLAALLLGLLLLAIAGRARADCSYTNQPGTVTFAPPATITLPNSLPVGTILWTSSPIPTANPPTLNCSGTTNSGVVNNIGAQSGSGDDTLFPTNVSGLSYRLLHPDTASPLHAYPNQSVPTGNISFSVASALQLVVTGPIAPGSVLTGGPFAQWNVDMCNGGNFFGYCLGQRSTNPVETFNTSAVRFVAPACSVVVDPTVVTLPIVLSSNFSVPGSFAGQTPFNVQLNCPSTAAGASIAITLATSAPASGASGVIAPTPGAGYSQGVGVQILDKNGTPITFGTAIPAGTVTAGSFNIQLNARYYQTGSPVTAGRVTATATYTLTYP